MYAQVFLKNIYFSPSLRGNFEKLHTRCRGWMHNLKRHQWVLIQSSSGPLNVYDLLNEIVVSVENIFNLAW